jgi:hypothetical protein
MCRRETGDGRRETRDDHPDLHNTGAESGPPNPSTDFGGRFPLPAPGLGRRAWVESPLHGFENCAVGKVSLDLLARAPDRPQLLASEEVQLIGEVGRARLA